MSKTMLVDRVAFKADVEAGMKKEELAAKYTNGNKSAVGDLLRLAGLRIKQTRKNRPVYAFADTVPSENTTSDFEKLQEAQEKREALEAERN